MEIVALSCQRMVNVVAEEGIDKYTVNFLKEVLEKNDRTMNLSEDIVSGKTNILLGVKESGGVADTYVADHITRGTADLFEKNDPYLLSADTDSDGNEVIAIVGKDTDCTFYGIATLQMMLSSFNNKEGKILDVQDCGQYVSGLHPFGSINSFVSLFRSATTSA